MDQVVGAVSFHGLSQPLVAIGLAWVVAPWKPRQNASPQAALRLRIDLGADASLAGPALGTPGPNIVLSPDGTTLAFVAQADPENPPELYVRRLDRLEAGALEGTQNASGPFFSHDSRWIAFFADGRLKKVAAAGGAVATICDAANVRAGQFTDDGAIVLSFESGVLTWMSPPGWSPEPLTTLAENELAQLSPQMLPGGRAVLFTSITRGADEADVVVQQVPRGARKVVNRGAHHGRYLRSGHLVYVRDGTLFAQPFDVRRLRTSGPARRGDCPFDRASVDSGRSDPIRHLGRWRRDVRPSPGCYGRGPDRIFRPG